MGRPRVEIDFVLLDSLIARWQAGEMNAAEVRKIVPIRYEKLRDRAVELGFTPKRRKVSARRQEDRQRHNKFDFGDPIFGEEFRCTVGDDPLLQRLQIGLR